MALLRQQGLLPENLVLDDHPMLGDFRFFAVILLLTVLTSAPKFFTVSKFFAQALDQLEAWAGLILFLLAVVLAQSSSGHQQAELLQAGVLELGRMSLLLLACVLHFVVVYTVKYFFEILALLTPIPLLDATFELGNKSLCFIFALLYAWNPYLALIPGLALFVLCLVIFSWARRGMRYYKTLLIDPLWKTLASGMLGRALPEVPVGPASRVSHALGERMTFVAKAFPVHDLGPFRARDLCYFAVTATGTYLVKAPWLRPPEILPLRGSSLTRAGGLAAQKVILREVGGVETPLIFSRYVDLRGAGLSPLPAPMTAAGRLPKSLLRGELFRP